MTAHLSLVAAALLAFQSWGQEGPAAGSSGARIDALQAEMEPLIDRLERSVTRLSSLRALDTSEDRYDPAGDREALSGSVKKDMESLWEFRGLYRPLVDAQENRMTLMMLGWAAGGKGRVAVAPTDVALINARKGLDDRARALIRRAAEVLTAEKASVQIFREARRKRGNLRIGASIAAGMLLAALGAYRRSVAKSARADAS